MDPSKIPQKIDPKKISSVGSTQQRSPPPSTAAPVDAVSNVLDDDDLLPLIIIRLGFPTSLVRATLVCKRWFRLASDISFLSGFRKLHPRCLLGFSFQVCSVDSVPFQQISSRFIPMQPHPIELATVVHRLDAYVNEETGIYGRRDCSTLIDGFWTDKLTVRGMADVPPLPQHNEHNPSKFIRRFSIEDKEEGHGFSYRWSLTEANRNEGNGECTMDIYMLQDGFWHMHASATTHLTYTEPDLEPLLIESKIYMRRVTEGDILVWDFMVSSFFTIQLPEGADYLHSKTMLSRANDSEVYLIHMKKLQLRIWLHKGENWLLVYSICLHRFCPVLRVPHAMTENKHNAIIRIGQIGDKDNSLFLKIGQYVLYLDIKHKSLRAVFKLTEEDQLLCRIHPVMMIWPPTFPALKDDPVRFAYGL